MSKLLAVMALTVKLSLITILLMYCTTWPGHDDFVDVENVCVVIVILFTGAAFTLETVAILAFRRERKRRAIWLVGIHLLAFLLAVLQSVCVFLYSQTTSNDYHHLRASLEWTNASDPSRMATAGILLRTVSIVIAVLSLATGWVLHGRTRSRAKAELEEIHTSAFMETGQTRDQPATGLSGTPYL